MLSVLRATSVLPLLASSAGMALYWLHSAVLLGTGWVHSGQTMKGSPAPPSSVPSSTVLVGWHRQPTSTVPGTVGAPTVPGYWASPVPRYRYLASARVQGAPCTWATVVYRATP